MMKKLIYENMITKIVNKNHDVSAKAQLIEYVRSNIKERKFKAGDKLPSTIDFARTAGVSSSTVRQAMGELIREGTLKAVPGNGTFIVDQNESKQANQRSVKTIGILPVRGRMETAAFEERFRNESVNGFIEGCDIDGTDGLILPYNVSTMKPQEVAARLKDKGCQGVVWLYPELEHWKIIEHLYSLNFPIVVTKRCDIDSNVAFVGADFQKAGSVLAKALIQSEIKEILIFDYSPDTHNSEINKYSEWPIGIVQGLQLGYKMFANNEDVKLEQVYLVDFAEKQCQIIFEKLESAKDSAVIFTSAYHLLNCFKVDSERIYSLLKGRKVSVVGNRSFLVKLAPYVRDINLTVLVDPFVEIAKCATQKLLALMNGHMLGTTTLMKIEIVEFSALGV